MKSTYASVAFSAGLALAVAGCAANTEPSAEEARGPQPVDQQQQRIASTTLALERAYDAQYVKGQIDPDALQPLIYDVLQSMPDEARAKAESHIYDVLSSGLAAAHEMTAEQREAIAAPVGADKVGARQVDWISAWGWPCAGYAGYGGYGAYPYYGAYGGYAGAYPYYGGYGYGGLGYGGYGYGAASTYVATSSYATGYGWGGLGAFGWPGYYGGLW